jgi:hypothetical protein
MSQRTPPRRSWLAALGYGALIAIVGWWTWRALHDARAWDTGLAYKAGVVAWATGHPEHVATWNGMPFLAAAMALVSRVLSVRATGDLMTVLNTAAAVAAVAILLRRTRGVIPAAWWWLLGFALVSFAPLMSTVWWKQFNLIALALAAAGFEFLRRGRVGWSGAAIGISLAVKPVAILLPFVMLAFQRTRRAGALALAWCVALNVTAQVLMAVRAHDLGTLDPLIGLRNFLDKTKPAGSNFFFLCSPENYSPQSLMCRIVGVPHWTIQHIFVLCGVALLGLWVVTALRQRTPLSWELFAFTCALSVMLGPLAWSHYQIVLAPLFVLLFFRFTTSGAGPGSSAGLLAAFVLASLIWQPYGTLVGAAQDAAGGSNRSLSELAFLDGLAQFAQYVLVLTGVLWYLGRGTADGRIADELGGWPP